MRLMMVGHSFLSAYNQTKYVTMKQINPELRVRLIVPTSMPGRFGPLAYEVHSKLSLEEVVPLKARPASWHMTYLHSLRRMADVLREFQPHVIHVEEEPQAFITVETIALQRTFAPGASVTLFTWDNLLRRRSFPLDTVKRRLRAYSLARATTVVCGNRRAGDLLRAEGRFKGSIEVLPQFGLDVTEHEPGCESELRSQLGLESSVVVGYVGRLVEEKGLRLLIKALGGLRDYPWKLLLVGSGPLEEEIRRVWMAKFPDRIVLVPPVHYSQVARHLRCADIFVLASYSTPSWMEQFGLTLAQAMMLGVASIGSTSGAIPDVLGPGGLVFQERQIDDLSRVLEELLASPARRQQLGALGRKFALLNYTNETVSARYLEAFKCAVSMQSSVCKGPSTVSRQVETTE
jgi:glycosyltransferase involved in cell wall biosynthesis